MKADLLWCGEGISPGRIMASDQEPTGVYVRGMYLQEQLGNLGEPTPSCVYTPENEGHTGRPKGLASAGKTSRPPTSRIRKKGAAGVDGVTAEEYAKDLENNLKDLHDRLRSGRYKAPPVERVWIGKDDGSQRPIGKPAFEDKILQRAVAMLMGAVFEQDFHEFSYGFRPGRRAHQALSALREQCMDMNIGTIVDADVSGFFDNINWKQLMEVIKKRVNDGVLIRLIGKWLHAGVMEDGVLSHPINGTPQGGVISPLLANIFLNHVLHEWWVKTVKPRMRGRCFLVRFADDFVVGFEHEDDAHRFMKVLPKRFQRFHLTIHPKKTRQIEFRKPDSSSESGSGKDTFDVLGFTHYWARSRRGYWVIKRRTARSRLRRTIKAIRIWCRNNRHLPVAEQHKKLCQKLRGHYAYFGIRSNMRQMERVFYRAHRACQFWLSRRSHKGYVSWQTSRSFVLSVLYPTPESFIKSDRCLQGSKVMRQRCVIALVTEEPYDRIDHVRICGGSGRATGRFYPEMDRKTPHARCMFASLTSTSRATFSV